MLMSMKGVKAVDKLDERGQAVKPTELVLMKKQVPISSLTMGQINSYITAVKRGAFVSLPLDFKDEA